MVDFFEWLKINESDMYGALNMGTQDVPSNWPVSLKYLYALHDGQNVLDDKKYSNMEDLFPHYGRWYSSSEAMAQQQNQQNFWKTAEGVETDDWWQESWLPIAGFEQQEQMLVIDLETEVIGVVDYELQEFDFVALDLEKFFSDLLFQIKSNGYSVSSNNSVIDLDISAQKELLKIKIDDAEKRYLNIYANLPEGEKYFIVGKSLFRHEANSRFGKSDGYAMELAKKYFDFASEFLMSKKQRQEFIFFKECYRKIEDKNM